jgi:signal transduction histidine kinase
MKLLLPFLILLPVFSFAQKREVFRIDSLPKAGILLNQGWKWHAGDNLEWAKPEFDDSGWEEIDPTKDIFELPQLSRSGEIGWFRIHLLIDSSIKQQMVMLIDQSGASEIYLNGKLIHRFGTLSANRQKIIAFTPALKPISFPISNKQVEVLAVRYALQPGVWYSTHFGMVNKGLAISLNTLENGINTYEFNYWIHHQPNPIRTGVFFSLAILYFAFYFFYRKRVVNLYFSIYALLHALSWKINYWKSHTNEVALFCIQNNATLILQTLGYFVMLNAIYQFLEQKKRWHYWALIFLGIISIPVADFVYNGGWMIYGLLFTNLVNVELTRVSIIAGRRNKKGAWIIATGSILALFCWLIFTLQSFFPFTIFGIDFFDLNFLCVPISVSIYLGYDVSLTNISLAQKLIEVETLSSEKQAILATQNETLERQVTERTAALKASQAQLIQSEKLASLGELTAGIAHEIQNPLNFVNNFSELSVELLEEMESDFKAGKSHDAFEIAADLKQNLSKINHHGQRASAILKGMLEHSRTSTGTKVATDINALADEYLRLSYHGLRAKDSSFNATMETHFDPDLPKIEVIPQDIGRVLLNLINNAFYAVQQRAVETLHATSLQYQSTVTITTRKLENTIEISVKDNGNGIPENIKDKIFQPFFTTKPTGQGTGLGLSLAYDIVTKGHGGTLSVSSTPGTETVFEIQLPIHETNLS